MQDHPPNNELWVTLIAAVQESQDTHSFERLFNHFAPRIKSFLMRSGADATLAEECAQDVMATVWQKSHLFDPARASVSTWIFTIARNKRIDAIRKQRQPQPEDLYWMEDHEPDHEAVMSLQQESDILAQALTELPEKQRVLVEQAYFGDMSHSEIAKKTGLPLGTIKSRIRLALDRLRHSVDVKTVK